MTDKITDLIAEARDVGRKGRKMFPPVLDLVKLIRALADVLEAEHQRAKDANGLLGMVAGVAASSIPDQSLRGKPMAAVVALSATLAEAEAERDALRAALKEALDVEESSYLLLTGRWPDKNSSSATWRNLSRAIDTKEN